jgi:hypothetical protein
VTNKTSNTGLTFWLVPFSPAPVSVVLLSPSRAPAVVVQRDQFLVVFLFLLRFELFPFFQHLRVLCALGLPALSFEYQLVPCDASQARLGLFRNFLFFYLRMMLKKKT